jgi:hypothetical protein
MPPSFRLQPLVQVLQTTPKVLPILLLRESIHTHRRVLAETMIGSFQGRHIDKMRQ